MRIHSCRCGGRATGGTRNAGDDRGAAGPWGRTGDQVQTRRSRKRAARRPHIHLGVRRGSVAIQHPQPESQERFAATAVGHRRPSW
jgi:hypothetical protein